MFLFSHRAACQKIKSDEWLKMAVLSSSCVPHGMEGRNRCCPFIGNNVKFTVDFQQLLVWPELQVHRECLQTAQRMQFVSTWWELKPFTHHVDSCLVGSLINLDPVVKVRRCRKICSSRQGEATLRLFFMDNAATHRYLVLAEAQHPSVTELGNSSRQESLLRNS